ncbi:putative cytochrome P450 [Xylariomycetidae sp. FL2044]|nr:putative cytochrome P450 [Xylariomycetidae sp. FL2044]
MGIETPFTILGHVLTLNNLVRLLGLWLFYRVFLAIYNISPLHPLSHVPGPKLASATYLYEAWYDLIQGGRYTTRIKEMHETYGPLVRINPDEVHCNDLAFVDEIYAGGGRRRDKSRHFVNFVSFPINMGMHPTVDHDVHRMRRGAVNRFFSRAQITKLEDVIKELIDQLCDKMLRLGLRDGAPFDVTSAYSCFMTDLISAYALGEPIGFLKQENWEPNFRKPIVALTSTMYLFRFIPPLRSLARIAPLFVKWMGEDLRILVTWSGDKMVEIVRQARKEFATGKEQDRPSVFHAIFKSSLPDAEKTDLRLSGEGFSLFSAGTETTSWALTVLTFYVLNQPAILARLTQELSDADALTLSWSGLEKLPYLSAVISESLRLSYGAATRLTRIAPDENLVYSGRFQGQKVEYVIPSGTAMSMSNAINHHDEDIYPDSHAFKPERWLGLDATERRRLESSLTSFSRGSRQCLATNLAYCNLYLLRTALTLRILPRLGLYETTVDDVRYDHDEFVPVPKKGTKGVRVILS